MDNLSFLASCLVGISIAWAIEAIIGCGFWGNTVENMLEDQVDLGIRCAPKGNFGTMPSSRESVIKGR